MSDKVVKVGLIQRATVTDKAANLKRALEGVREASGRGARVVCL